MMPDLLGKPWKRLDSIDWAAGLVGAGGGFLAFGLLEHLFWLLDPTPATWRMMIGASMFALSLGLMVPHRLAARVATHLRQRSWQSSDSGGTPPACRDPALPGGQKDRALHRVVLAGLALLCGGTSIVSLGLVRMARGAYGFVVTEFLWGPAPLLAVEAALVMVVALFVFVPVGLTWGCLHHLSCPVGGWRVRPLAGVSVGLAAAAWVTSSTLGHAIGLSPDLFLLIGSVPFFLVSMLSTRFSARTAPRQQRFAASVGRMQPPVPQIGDRWSALVQAAVIVTFACACLSAGIWWRVFDILAAGTGSGGGLALTMWGLGFATGVGGGCALSARRRHSIGALGLVCALSGVGTALAGGLLGLLAVWGHKLAGLPGGGFALSAVIVGLPTFGLGHAVTYGYYAALARVSHQSELGTALLSRSVFAGGCVVVFVLSPLVLKVGTYAAMVAVSLILVGVGGALVIHEPTPVKRTRRRRLGVIFGSIAFMSLVLPLVSGGWLASRSWKRLRLVEGAWLTRSIWAVKGDIRSVSEPACRGAADRPAGRDSYRPDLPMGSATGGTRDSAGAVDWRFAPDPLHMLILGSLPERMVEELAAASERCDHRLFDPSLPARHRRAGLPPRAAPGPETVAFTQEPALRFLRRTPRTYDVIVIGLADLPPAAWTAAMRSALLERALDRLRIDGLVLLVAPAAPRPHADLFECAGALRDAGCTDFTWSSTSRGFKTTLSLAFGKGPQWRERWRGSLAGSEKSVMDTLPRAGVGLNAATELTPVETR